MTPNRRVAEGDRVSVQYTLELPEGEPIQTRDDDKPVSFTAGSEEVLPPLSSGVIGMSPGESKKLTIPPEQAFGKRDHKLLEKVPRGKIPEGIAQGDRVMDANSKKSWIVKDLNEETAVLDGNHPLAGETIMLHFQITAVA